MTFMKSFKGHWVISTTRKKPELILHETIENKKIIYVNTISEAIYLVVQLPNGNPNQKVIVRCYQALTKDGTTDDTEPTTTIEFSTYHNERVQKSDIVLTLAPYIKLEIEVTEPIEVKVWYDYM